MASRAQNRDAKVIYNLAPAGRASRELFDQVDYLIVNEIEAFTVAGCDTKGDPTEVVETLAREYGLTVVITLGAMGVVAFSRGELIRLPAPTVEVIDTTGAGDTFCGYFAAEVAKKSKSIESCLEIAGRAASIACTHPGAQSGIPYASQIF